MKKWLITAFVLLAFAGIAVTLPPVQTLFYKGERSAQMDRTTGEYTADYEHFTGKEPVFGGACTEEVTILLRGDIRIEEGTVSILLTNPTQDTIFLTSQPGPLDLRITLPKGSSYIEIRGSNFTGTVHLESLPDPVIMDE